MREYRHDEQAAFVLFGLLAAVCLLVIPFFALGKEGDQDAALVKVEPQDQPSKKLFADNCGACHARGRDTDGVDGGSRRPAGDGSETRRAVRRHLLAGDQRRHLRARRADTEGHPARRGAKQVAAFVAAYAERIGKGPTVDVRQPKAGSAPVRRLPVEYRFGGGDAGWVTRPSG